MVLSNLPAIFIKDDLKMSILYTSISVSAEIHYVSTEDLIHSLATTFNPKGMMLEWKCNGYHLSQHTGV